MKNNLEEFILEQCNLTTKIQQESFKAGYIAGYQARERELKAEDDKMVENMFRVEELRKK